MAVKKSLVTVGNKWSLELDSAPNVGDGFQAPIGSEAKVEVGGVGSEWIKYGSNATDWRDTSDEIFNTVTYKEISSDPTAPSSGGTTFLRNVGGRQMLAFIGKSGLDYTIQPHIGRNKTLLWQANGNAITFTAIGSTLTANGTATTRPVATTNFFSWFRRLAYLSASTANQSCGLRTTFLQFGRGNIAGVGGFHVIARCGISDASAVANARTFVGLTSSTTVLGNVNPSTLLNIIGFGNDSADTNMQVFTNDGSGSATKVDLGLSFPATTRNADMYEFDLFCPPNGSEVFWGVTNLSLGVKAFGSFTTNIPLNTQLLAFQIWRHNGGTALPVAVDIVNAYIETDN